MRDLTGDILELGLGNGRTYDHLRELFPDRAIYVCERIIAAHPECIPPPDRLILGDMRDTLSAIRERFCGRVALAHLDAGTGDVAASRALATEVAPLITPLLCESGLLVSGPAVAQPALIPLGLPQEVAPGRHHLYRLR